VHSSPILAGTQASSSCILYIYTLKGQGPVCLIGESLASSISPTLHQLSSLCQRNPPHCQDCKVVASCSCSVNLRLHRTNDRSSTVIASHGFGRCSESLQEGSPYESRRRRQPCLRQNQTVQILDEAPVQAWGGMHFRTLDRRIVAPAGLLQDAALPLIGNRLSMSSRGGMSIRPQRAGIAQIHQESKRASQQKTCIRPRCRREPVCGYKTRHIARVPVFRISPISLQLDVQWQQP